MARIRFIVDVVYLSAVVTLASVVRHTRTQRTAPAGRRGVREGRRGGCPARRWHIARGVRGLSLPAPRRRPGPSDLHRQPRRATRDTFSESLDRGTCCRTPTDGQRRTDRERVRDPPLEPGRLVHSRSDDQRGASRARSSSSTSASARSLVRPEARLFRIIASIPMHFTS